MVVVHCSGDGRVVLVDSAMKKEAASQGLPPPMPAVDLDLEKVSSYLCMSDVLCVDKFVLSCTMFHDNASMTQCLHLHR